MQLYAKIYLDLNFMQFNNKIVMKCTSTVAIIFLVTFVQIKYGNLWVLQSISNITNYTVRHVTVYYMRAFLCIESLNQTNNKIPTLVETTWPENLIPKHPKVFPSLMYHACSENECNKIQTALSTDIDKKLRLWVLDGGSAVCPPKLWIFTIIPFHDDPLKMYIDMPAAKVTAVKTDPHYNKNGSTRGFISVGNEQFLLVFYMKEKKFVKLLLKESVKPFYPTEMSWLRENQLFLASQNTDELFLLNLKKSKRTSEKNVLKVSMKLMGYLLGPPKSLTVDPNGNLYYIIPRDGAVVRWNGNRPITAEKHEVMFQIAAEIIQILFGARGSIWIVTSQPGMFSLSGPDDHCFRILHHYGVPTFYFDANESDYNYDE